MSTSWSLKHTINNFFYLTTLTHHDFSQSFQISVYFFYSFHFKNCILEISLSLFWRYAVQIKYLLSLNKFTKHSEPELMITLNWPNGLISTWGMGGGGLGSRMHHSDRLSGTLGLFKADQCSSGQWLRAHYRFERKEEISVRFSMSTNVGPKDCGDTAEKVLWQWQML